MIEAYPLFTCNAGSGFPYCARINGLAGSPIVQADITSIAYKVFDLSAGNVQVGATGSLTVATSVYNTMQTDARWEVDATGYNFSFCLPASYTAALGGHRLQVEVLFTPATGEAFSIVFHLDVRRVF
jgi:hypothetical protein